MSDRLSPFVCVLWLSRFVLACVLHVFGVFCFRTAATQMKLMNCTANGPLCVVLERWVLIIKDLVFWCQQNETSTSGVTREHLKQLATHH
ncbi:unnamed protein product [Tenebrio molitor]|nr:unnamed protein product [Tenebrio molitor]